MQLNDELEVSMSEFYDGMNKGERQLHDILKTMENEQFFVHSNVILERVNDGTNQIDTLAVTKKGIFVFEMKDFKGWIFGNEDHKEWTQVLYQNQKKPKKIKFRNPVKQNDNHIKTVKHILNSSRIHVPVFNVVVFGIDAELMEITASCDVIRIENVLEVVEKYPDLSIDTEMVKSINDILTEHFIKGDEAMKNHLDYVSTLFNPSGNNQESPSARYSSNADLSGSEEKSGAGHWTKSTSVKNGIKILLLAIAAFYALNEPLILVLILLFLIPSKKSKRQRRNKSSGLWIVAVIIIIGAYGYNQFYKNPSSNDESELNKQTYNTQTSKVESSSELVESVNPEVSTEAVVWNETVTYPIESAFPPEQWESSESVFSETVQTENVTTTEAANTSFETNGSVSSVYLDLGVNKNLIKGVLGEPNRINGNTEYYGSSSVSYDQNGNVTAWKNVYGEINKIVQSPIGGVIRLQMSRDYILNALGTPSMIEERYPYTWYYGSSKVNFNSDWKVSGWNNVYGEISTVFEIPIGGKLELGLNSNDVISILGTPKQIDYNNQFTWFYGSSKVIFDSEWNVKGWNDVYGELKKAFYNPQKGKLSLGISKTEVINALGTPTEIPYNNNYIWYYGSSKVTFDSGWNVTGWDDVYGELKVALSPSGGGFLILGMSREDVVKVLGTPSEINSGNIYVWYYGSSKVTFNNNWTINGWHDVYGEIKPFLSTGNGGTLAAGSTKEDVIRVLGYPSEVSGANPSRWIYKNSYVVFDSNWTVQSWKNVYGQFNGVFPEG